uniref:Uncharacterized protein n=1 Tax=Denticeps clupeoides TaxID=299321 RepID=A0AAY4AD09_9TELE
MGKPQRCKYSHNKDCCGLFCMNCVELSPDRLNVSISSTPNLAFMLVIYTTQQTPQDPHATHPTQLLRHTGIGCTLSLTCGETISEHDCVFAAPGTRVHGDGLLDDQTILHQLTDLLDLTDLPPFFSSTRT